MENKQWVDAVLGRQVKPKQPRNLVLENAWEDLKAGKITAFEYNHKIRQVEKLTAQQ